MGEGREEYSRRRTEQKAAAGVTNCAKKSVVGVWNLQVQREQSERAGERLVPRECKSTKCPMALADT